MDFCNADRTERLATLPALDHNIGVVAAPLDQISQQLGLKPSISGIQI